MAVSKHLGVYRKILDAIERGEFSAGARMPAETELVTRFGVSRPTIARALAMLEQEGRLVRRRGAGTFVRAQPTTAEQLIGLVAPSVERGGTFDRLCATATNGAKAAGHSVIFGTSVSQLDDIDAWARSLCDQLRTHHVRGALFLPMEVPPQHWNANRRIADALFAAGIPLVLMDRDVCVPPERSPFDLVGIDNRRAGETVTGHLLSLGVRRIHFLCHDMPSSSSVYGRIEGYRSAMRAAGLGPPDDWLHLGLQPENLTPLPTLVREMQPEAFVCVNDHLARDVLYALSAAGLRVPQDIRMVSIDDLPFAQHGPVRLTTLHQPVDAIGANAVAALLSRIADPHQPPRDIHIGCRLVVRQSCGVELARGTFPLRTV